MNDLVLAIEHLKKASDLLIIVGEAMIKKDRNYTKKIIHEDIKLESVIKSLQVIESEIKHCI